MIIKSNKTLVNDWYAHASFPSSISNKRVRLNILEEELVWFESQTSLDINLASLSWGETNQPLYPLLKKNLLTVRHVVTA